MWNTSSRVLFPPFRQKRAKEWGTRQAVLENPTQAEEAWVGHPAKVFDARVGSRPLDLGALGMRGVSPLCGHVPDRDGKKRYDVSCEPHRNFSR